MTTARKESTVEELTQAFGRTSLAIQTEYRGLSMAELTAIRRAFRSEGIQYTVVKNTLGRIAAENAGMTALRDALTGPTALVLGGEDPIAPARALDAYLKANPRTTLKVVGGVLDGRALTAEQVTALANLPSREELIAKLMGTLNSPITGLVNVLSGPIRGLQTVLAARQAQLEQQG